MESAISVDIASGFMRMVLMFVGALSSTGLLGISRLLSARATDIAKYANKLVAVAICVSILITRATGYLNTSVVLTVAVGMIVSIVGLQHWDTLLMTPAYRRYFVIFSYPFFCAFPFVLIYSSLGIHNFFPWQTVALIWFTIITFCTVLWQRGQMLDRAARNPFQKILEGYYEGPIPLAPLGRGNRK